MPDEVKVALVIPVYNRRETTLRALSSLAKIDRTGLNVQIFVVDDASTDGTADAVRKTFPEVKLIEGTGSLHYAGGTNRGIEAAMDWSADFVVTMNDDSVFHEQFLQRLISTAKGNPRSVVGALLLLWSEPHRVFQVAPVWKTWRAGWKIPDDLTAFTVPQEPFAVEVVVGNCVLFPAEAIRQCGLMDAAHFPYGWGDAQYTTRMRKAGWNLLVDPKAYVWCEPNTLPPALHTLPALKTLDILLRDQRHPLNFKRQFDALWHSSPTRVQAVAAFGAYCARITAKAVNYGILKRA